jgi:hypothetical protein
LLLFGYFYARLTAWAQLSAIPMRLAAVATVSGFFTKIVRGDMQEVTRPLVWNALAPYCLVILVNHYLQKQRRVPLVTGAVQHQA